MKKKKIILILVAIVLGITSYFLATSLTKSYLDKESKKDTKIDFSEMTKLETSKDISLEKLIKKYNKFLNDNNLGDYVINQKKLDRKESFYEYTINNITYVFQVTNKSVDIMTIYYKEENDITKELIKYALKANNEELEDGDIAMLYDSIINTRNNEEKNGAKISEYYQYKGLETNLKETIIGNKSIYQFRIGRIKE